MNSMGLNSALKRSKLQLLLLAPSGPEPDIRAIRIAGKERFPLQIETMTFDTRLPDFQARAETGKADMRHPGRVDLDQ